MRRRSIGAILFSLALLVQILAPAAAARMRGSSNGLAPAAICAGGEARNHSAPVHLPARHDHCEICHSIGGAPAVAAAPPLCVAAVYARPRAWAASPEPGALSGEDQHRPPRGPPALS